MKNTMLGFSESMVITHLIVRLSVILFCLPIHEYAHGIIANKLGDPTAKNMGRLTLNPFAHLDIWGALLLFVLGFGYAKPVPVNPYYLRKPKRDLALIALAGPLTNLILALFIIVLYSLLKQSGVADNPLGNWILYFCSYAAYINLGLFVFNLLPIPPLDGFKVLCGIIPNRYVSVVAKIEKYSVYILMGLIFIFHIIGMSPTQKITEGLYLLMISLCT